jgi:nucleoid DNA-binding protein
LKLDYQLSIEKMEKIMKKHNYQHGRITERDVLIIWDSLAFFIRKELLNKRGTVIPGFGTFTYIEQRLDIGRKQEILKLMPWFVISEKMVKTHSIDYEKAYVNEAIPVSRINYMALSELTKGRYTRDEVEAVLNEAFMAINHFIRNNITTCIPFNGLGQLTVRRIPTKPKLQADFDFFATIADQLPDY